MGIVPRFFQDLFAQTQTQSLDGSLSACSVTMTFLELYNDCLYDLLKFAELMPSISSLRGAVREAAL